MYTLITGDREVPLMRGTDMTNRVRREPDCHPERPYRGRGYCAACYSAARRAGTLGDTPLRGVAKRMADCHPDRSHWSQGMCQPCANAKYREEHAEEKAAYMKAWRKENAAHVKEYKIAHPEPNETKRIREAKKYAANPDAYWERNLQTKYGISVAEYHELLKAQDSQCAICRIDERTRRLDVDHDHETKEVRGLLCGKCNRAIGLFLDDVDLCERAAKYLRAWETRRRVHLVQDEDADA